MRDLHVRLPSLNSAAAFRGVAATVCGLILALWPHLARAEWHTLTGPLPNHISIGTPIVSPDSSRVVFVADMDTDDVDELYSVPISSSTPIKLNPPLVQDGDVERARVTISPNSEFVFYVADQEVDNRNELYSVPIDGGPAIKLNGPLAAGGNVILYRVDEGTERIVYSADQETNEVLELWSVPMAGGVATKISGPLVTGGNVGTFLIDPLSDRVVYSADAETNGKSELYSVPIAGGTVVKLNPPIVLTGGGDGGIGSQFAINPIIPVVVFIARQSDEHGGRLYSIPTAGGTLNLLSFNLLDTQRILSFLISPSGDRVVFNVGTRVGSTNAFSGVLHSNLIGAGGAAQVTESADPLFGTDNYRFLPDGSRLVYLFQPDADTPERLESATVLGERTPLHMPLSGDPALVNYILTPDSAWVLYLLATGGSEVGLRAIPPTGGGSTNHGTGRFGAFTPDSQRLLHYRSTDADGHNDLISAQIFGGGVRNLSGLHGTGFVTDVQVSPDAKWAVFEVQVEESSELRVSDGEEAQAPILGLAATNDSPKVISEPIAFTTVITIAVGSTEEISYTWAFGDGEVGSGATTTHTYESAGVYTATVTATGLANSVAAATTVYVGDAVVEVTNNAYTPQDVTIPHGGTVIWVLKEGNHSVTADDGSFEQPAGTDWPPFVHTFDHSLSAVGAEPITYHCSVHGASMSGSITVLDPTPGGTNRMLLPLVRK